MKRSSIQDIYRLSPMQEGILFHSLYAPEDGVYFEQLSCRLAGALDVDAFRRAWQWVVDRHPILRTLLDRWHGEAPPTRWASAQSIATYLT